ncbi:hypothetical protein GGH12_002043 [Coemansia sp. RSA 1822]|nr:hypothetical protein LPJ76_000931 [Coemansia sp. RSA 638]KAJ2564288.1 hypothetical protein GGH12_002043 [Coemansia sp. RSA 1822]
MSNYEEMATSAVRVPIWTGSGNFNAWSDKVMSTLQEKGCTIAIAFDLRKPMPENPYTKAFNATDFKTDGHAAAILKNALSDIHDGQFTNMTAFEIWAELKKLYSTQSADNMVNKIIDLFNFRMVPDNLDGHKFLVQFNFLRKKIDLTRLTCNNLINLILLASLNKHYEPVRTKFSKTPAAEISEADIFKFGSTLSDQMKAQAERDEKHAEITVAAAANTTRPVCKHCNHVGHTIDSCWT